MKGKTKVFVGISGGVDSSVSAALLKKAGYDVTGVFIKVWHPDFFICDWKEDRRDAMRACAKLGIDFLTLDLEKEYKKGVVDYMISEYKIGNTPNPDVMCNSEIKFGAFLKFAQKHGAHFIATGHYAQKRSLSKGHELLISKDKEKDQSYFLWTLSQSQLDHTLFPVGHLKKPQVRRLAREFGLANAEKKDSQGLCFMGKIDIKEFLSTYIKPKKGVVLDIKGKKIGYHDGAWFLTIGQRHGFTVINKKPSSRPLYIVNKDVIKNTITVSELNKNDIKKNGTKIIELSKPNWINESPHLGQKYGVRFRYRQNLLPARIEKSSKNWLIVFDEEINGGSVGQSIVVYDGNKCLGGGIIKKLL